MQIISFQKFIKQEYISYYRLLAKIDANMKYYKKDNVNWGRIFCDNNIKFIYFHRIFGKQNVIVNGNEFKLMILFGRKFPPKESNNNCLLQWIIKKEKDSSLYIGETNIERFDGKILKNIIPIKSFITNKEVLNVIEDRCFRD